MTDVADLTIPTNKEVVDGLRQLRVWHWQQYKIFNKKSDPLLSFGLGASYTEFARKEFRDQATMHIKIVQLLNCFISGTAEQDEKAGY